MVAAEVADRQGVRVVVASGTEVLSADERVDITEALVAELRERGFETVPPSAAGGVGSAHAAAPLEASTPPAEEH